MKRWHTIAINVTAFDVLWTTAMFGAGKPWWWAAPTMIVLSMVLQLTVAPIPGREATVILAGAAVGTSVDWLGSSLGMFHYASGSTAEFLMVFGALWVNFGTTLRPSFQWMWRRPMLAAVCGACGGPAAYWIGSRIGAISFGEQEWRGLVWVAVHYGVAVPLWMVIASGTIGERGEASPRQTAPGVMR